jgi:hypothetical protein
MITQYKDFSFNHPIQDQKVINRVIEDYLGSYERKMMVFENYWNSEFFSEFSNQSVKPFIGNIGSLIGESVTVGHRFIDSTESLRYYLKDPGVIWDTPESWGCNVWYFGFHGKKNGIEFPHQLITQDELLDIFSSNFNDFPNILYFSSCQLFKDKDFGFELLEKSGTRGILGFTKKIGYGLGTIVDLLFLLTFYNFKDGDPFQNLDLIYDTVIQVLPISKKMGFTLFH